MVDRVEWELSPFKPGGLFVAPDGTLTGDAYRHLDTLWKRTGGFSDESWDSRAITEGLQTQIGEINQQLSALLSDKGFGDESRVLDLIQRIEALEARADEPDSDAALNDLLQRVEALEAGPESADTANTLDLIQRIEALESGLSDVADLGESALRLASNVGSDNLIIKELTDGRIAVAINGDGAVLIDGYEVNKFFSSSPGALQGITNSDNTGKVLARIDLDEVRTVNLWSLLGTDIVFGTHGTGTMGPGQTASFELEVWYTGPDGSPIAIGGNFGSVGVTAYQVSASAQYDWAITLDDAGNITINSEIISGNPSITNDELNEEIGSQNIRFPSAALGASHIYLVGRWISTTAADPAGIVLRFTTSTTLAATNLLNRSTT